MMGEEQVKVYDIGTREHVLCLDISPVNILEDISQDISSKRPWLILWHLNVCFITWLMS